MDQVSLKLICRGCGASLEYSPSEQALKCPYCGTATEIPRSQEEIPEAPELIIPLSVNETRLTDAVYEHLAGGDLTPDHLLEHATFTKKERFYVPAYCFFGDFEAQWTASFGYDHREQYTVYETRTENGHSRQVPVTKTKTVTDWRPVNGSDSGNFAVYAYAGTRLLGASVDVCSIVEDRSIGETTAFDSSYVTGIPAEEFVNSETDAYRDRAKSQVNSTIDQSVQQHAQGDRQRDWHWTADIDKRSFTVFVPVCHAVYEFEGKTYNVWTSGADASRVVADPLPVDTGRQVALYWGWAPLCAALVSSAVAIFKFDASWSLPLITAVAAGSYGGLRKNAILGHSRQLRQSLLANRRAASSNTAGMSGDEQKALMASAKRPGKPWLANTALDKLVLPMATMLVAAIPLATFLAPARSHDYVESPQFAAAPQVQSAPTSTSPAAEVKQATQPVTTTQVETTPVESASAPPIATPSVPVAYPTPQPASAAAPTDTLAPVANLLGLTKADDWKAIDEQVALIKAQAPTPNPGDRKTARSSNNEGLIAFKGNDFPAAISAFQRGLVADPADVELRNNLGYALLKAGNANEAVSTLGHLLLKVPDRSSAWANLAEATSPQTDVSVSALRLAVHFSANRERTLTFLSQAVENHPDEKFRGVASTVLASIDGIPKNPNDRSQQAAPPPQ